MVKQNNVEIDADVALKQEQAQETTEETAAPPQESADAGAGPAGQVDADAARAELEALHKKIEELEREKEEYLQSYRRLLADFDNYKRRTRKELLEAADSGKEELLVKLLPVLDNLELALKATGEPDKWRSGVEMIFRQFLGVLVEVGLKPIPAVGEMFDPKLHEALMREPSEQPENTILEEIKKGYLFGEKTIRPTLVKVAAAPESVSGKEKE
ncbi:nucleotide exchange factor GrpE [Capillibacterium thermochitinicola]|uniref:Protein GrpE n=1 Tax=Capillibacterium thermochitinicola TaxID=2699427 RepID=A0A8J6I1K7_9FIRM|nr:nucleotide exchange factor GrpE [Capillibacterium thermochitinicola]MBA2132592.1 nucleotide exchange factor GrpE [Capillibacterium thermochitinicola]